MARRQAVQLQTDLQADEDFDKFLEIPGLLVLDVYTEWCGPCIGMVNALRKVKLEQGGDILNLAIARADTISYLHRFYKKSEPTWLFVTQGKIINIMFGADCPRLIDLIIHEMKALGKAREMYSVTEMLPIEIERDNAKNAVKRAKLQKELDEQERKKTDYLHYVTETIRENLPDAGIIIFGPHIQRETFRHLIDYGSEKFGIVCKDRRTQIITKEQFDTISNFSKNPLSPDILEAIDGKELFICFWRVADESKEPVVEILQKYAEDITKSHKLPPDEYHSEEQVIPPLVTPTRVQLEFELPVGQECPVYEEPEQKDAGKHHKSHDSNADARGSGIRDSMGPADENVEDEEGDEDEENEGEGPVEEPNQEAPTAPGFDMPGFDDDAENLSEGEEEEEIVDDTPIKNICTKTVTVPAAWVPKDWRTHALIIYMIFHSQTTGFLPPDPVPEPPHIIMAFDTYKKRDLVDFAERNKEDIPLYGFFTSDEADEAKHIASSKNNYLHHTPAASDKLIFKVNKRTSHTMLSLATYGPTYVSPNTTVGAEEAKIFFPDNYISAEQEVQETLAKNDTDNKPKVKKGQKVDEAALRTDAVPLDPVTAAKEPAVLEPQDKKPEEVVAADAAVAEAAVVAEVPAVAEVAVPGEQTAGGETSGVAVEAGQIDEAAAAPTNEETVVAPTNNETQQAQTEETAAAPTEEAPVVEAATEKAADMPPEEAVETAA